MSRPRFITREDIEALAGSAEIRCAPDDRWTAAARDLARSRGIVVVEAGPGTGRPATSRSGETVSKLMAALHEVGGRLVDIAPRESARCGAAITVADGPCRSGQRYEGPPGERFCVDLSTVPGGGETALERLGAALMGAGAHLGHPGCCCEIGGKHGNSSGSRASEGQTH